MATLIEFILKNNYFSFNNNFYLQSQGTAMGTKMAPAYANIFMDKIESEMLQNFPLKPSHYMRYIDDIFFIWPHGHSTLKDFHHFVNSFHHSIKFTFEISTSEIPFLDVLVKLRSNSISTSVFYKPTDNHQYLHFSSSHPLSLKKSIVFSQCLRLKRICSDPIDYKDSISRLTGFFLSNGYPLLTIKSGIAKADPYKREDLLRYKEKSGGDRIPLVFDHHPNIRNLAHTLKTDFASLQEDSNLSELFSEPPVLALRQPPNLKQILTSSKLPKTHTPPMGNTKCNKSRCQVCHYIDTGNTVQIPGCNLVFYPPNLNCDSSNIVYIIFCTYCQDGNYVGETSTSFRLRFNNHKKSIRDNFPGFPVAEHFNLPNHSLKDLKFCIIGHNFPSTQHRKNAEIKWILKINSHTNGLNRDLGSFNCFSFPRQPQN